MKEIIMKIPEIDYVLVHWPENTYTPWVAAWCYNEERNSWGQGHYFQKKESAVEYLVEMFKKRYGTYAKNRLNEIKNLACDHASNDLKVKSSYSINPLDDDELD